MTKNILIFFISLFAYSLALCAIGTLFNYIYGWEISSQAENVPPIYAFAFLGALHVGGLYAVYCALDFAVFMVKYFERVER